MEPAHILSLQAAENKVRFGCGMASRCNAAARGGVGDVFGSLLNWGVAGSIPGLNEMGHARCPQLRPNGH
jgi:hypothetical protein